MAKQDMKRPERSHGKPQGQGQQPQEPQGKAKNSDKKAKPITEN